MTSVPPRILLIHALFESLTPIWKAFEAQWPEARLVNLLDDSLSADLARDGGLTDAMIERFLLLGRYGTGASGNVPKAEALLFTCSAFGAAIDQVKAALPIPVLKPNEAAFEAAVDAGSTIGLMVTFPAALPPLEAELRAMAKARGKEIQVIGRVVDGALAALKGGDAGKHNALIADAATGMPSLDVLVLGQFSMAQAAPSVMRRLGRSVITTPDSAVKKLKELLTA